MKIYMNTFFCILGPKFSLSINISDLNAKLKKWQVLQDLKKKVTLQELHYIIYSEGSNVCTVIPRKGFLILDKFYVSNVYNWISRNFFIRYKMPQNRKNRQKTGKILMKSFWYFRHCKILYYINHWYRMCLYDQHI